MKRISGLLFLCILLFSCAFTHNYMKVPKGVTSKKILIKTEPTKARIYINDIYIGKSPVKTTLWYEKEKFVNIKAEPIFPNQFPQNVFIKIPPIPPKLTIYMNYDKGKKTYEEEPEEKPEKVIVIEKEYITQNVPIPLPVIYFDFDKYDLHSESFSKLEKIAELLTLNSDLMLSIHAHADEQGKTDYNYQLSYNRGIAVKAALQKMGIDSERLEIFVHGEQQILKETKEPLQYKHNRVVDFQLHKRD